MMVDVFSASGEKRRIRVVCTELSEDGTIKSYLVADKKDLDFWREGAAFLFHGVCSPTSTHTDE